MQKNEYSHITSLGVTEQNKLTNSTFVGQKKLRIALSYIRDKINSSKNPSLIIFEGPKSSGKSTAIFALLNELENKESFVDVSAVEIPNFEKIDEICRRASFLTVKETKNVYTGELTEIYRNALRLKSRKGAFLVEGIGAPDLKMAEGELETIKIGDIVHIEGQIIKKMGKSASKGKFSDLEAVKYLPLPKGEVFSRVEKTHSVSLFDLDYFKTKDFRFEVDKKVEKDIREGRAIFKRGLLFIRDGDFLSDEQICYLNKKTDEKYSPLIVVEIEKNKKWVDFLTIRSVLRTEEEKREIIDLKIKEFGLVIGDDLLEKIYALELKIAVEFLKVVADCREISADDLFNIFDFN